MLKYIIGLGAIVVGVVGYISLSPANIVSQDAPPVSAEQDVLLEDLVADARENVPLEVTETLTLTDIVFLPRFQIMEYVYVTTSADARDVRIMVEGRADTICSEEKQMFEMGVTHRYSFEDSQGKIFQRVYILPEDCRRLN